MRKPIKFSFWRKPFPMEKKASRIKFKKLGKPKIVEKSQFIYALGR